LWQQQAADRGREIEDKVRDLNRKLADLVASEHIAPAPRDAIELFGNQMRVPLEQEEVVHNGSPDEAHAKNPQLYREETGNERGFLLTRPFGTGNADRNSTYSADWGTWPAYLLEESLVQKRRSESSGTTIPPGRPGSCARVASGGQRSVVVPPVPARGGETWAHVHIHPEPRGEPWYPSVDDIRNHCINSDFYQNSLIGTGGIWYIIRSHRQFVLDEGNWLAEKMKLYAEQVSRRELTADEFWSKVKELLGAHGVRIYRQVGTASARTGCRFEPW
jgi:hypothetical protein